MDKVFINKGIILHNFITGKCYNILKGSVSMDLDIYTHHTYQ